MNGRDGVLAGSSLRRAISPLIAGRAEHGFGFDRRWLTAWFAAFAVYAALMTAFGIGGEDGVWGIWATCGYALAAILASRSRGFAVPLLVAFGFAMVAPAIWLAVRDPATADVIVVSRSASLLLHHGSPYLPVSQLATWTSYNPYLPAMALFGLPSASGLQGAPGDPRVWLVLVTVAALAAGLRVLLPHSVRRCADCRRDLLRATAFAVACPVLALNLAVTTTDPPVLALMLLALSLISYPERVVPAAAALGLACAMKPTAWLAIPVLAAMVRSRDGTRQAVVFTGTTLAFVTAATLPAAVASPAAMVQNTVLFPLGLTRHLTPAASLTPGDLLARLGPAGHTIAVALLLIAGLAVAVSLIVRPPRNLRAATWRLAIGLALMFALGPAERFGYFIYPLGLAGWLLLTHRQPGAAGAGRQTPTLEGGT